MERYQYPADELAFIERSKIPFGVFQFIDKRLVTIALAQGFCDLFDFNSLEEAYISMENNMYSCIHNDDIARISDVAFRFVAYGEPYDTLFRSFRHSDQELRLIHALGEHITAGDGTKLVQVWYTNESKYDQAHNSLFATLSDAIFTENSLMATYYDHLTGLPGMTYFFELSTSKKAEIQDAGEEPTVLFTDFSGMKYFNHKNGFSAGDKLLQSYSKLLAHHFGKDNCSRFGQDHFAVITKKNGLEETLRTLFEECTTLNNGMSLPLHVGIYDQWYDNIVASMACDRAKIACDSLSTGYSSGFSYYNSSMKDAEEKHQYIIANIDKAIKEHWITVYYQPIVRAVNGRVCDEEALARWIDPVKGFLSPGDFIPILEEHRLIYKLDLFILECVLEKIKTLSAAGLHIMPQSINLSRSDFDTCDIVEEIRERVDASGLSRSMITIEITESMIGQDFEFMVAQINRLREYGFAVWMDDFGSGYSSLDVLQSVEFDLIKFDMRFMQNLGNGNKGKIILTELINMATSLGIDTVCEGVETEEQMRFLQEAGCSKLQGYFFEKPIPVEKILEKYRLGIQIGFENPSESQYYETVGSLNLHDLSIVASDEINKFDNFFNTLPMAVLELNGFTIRIARANQSYRDFIHRYYGFQPTDQTNSFLQHPEALNSPFVKALQKCSSSGKMMYVDEEFDHYIVHSCIRRITVNAVTGTTAVAVAVLSITDNSTGTTYANIAKALAANYVNLYYVDLSTDDFIEYSSKAGDEDLAVERHGADFFSESRKDALDYIHQEDRDMFLSVFTKENILNELKEQGTFTLTYRLLINKAPVYVNMKIMRMQYDDSHLIIGVESIDSQMKQKIALDNIRKNELIYSRIMALTGDYICMYTVDPETNNYYEYSAAYAFEKFGLAKAGKDFFVSSHMYSSDTIYADDQQHFKEMFTKEHIMECIRRSGIFSLEYRLMIDGAPVKVVLRGALVSESDGKKLIFGVQYAH